MIHTTTQYNRYNTALQHSTIAMYCTKTQYNSYDTALHHSTTAMIHHYNTVQ